MMVARTSALLGALLISACQSSDSPSPGDDAGPSRDGGARDGSIGPDGGRGDGGPLPGVRVAQLPADLVAVTGGGREVLYLRSGELVRVAPDGTGRVAMGYRPVYGYGPTPNLWLWSELDADTSVGVMAGYAPLGPPTVTVLDRRVATDTFAVDEEGEVVVVATDVQTRGDTTSSTRTASLARFDVTGSKRVLMSGLTLGRWDTRTRQHVCGPEVELMSRTQALAIVCTTPGSNSRTLVAIDLVTRTTTVVARDVVPFLRASDDKSFALFADSSLAFHGVSPSGARVVRLDEPRRITSIVFIGGPRLAYTTVAQDLQTSEWPALRPAQLLPLGADTIEAVSPDGRWVMFRQARAATGLRDLYLVGTSSTSTVTPVALAAEPDGYPGDDPFSADSAWVQWFARADLNFIGDVMARPTAGGEPRRLAERGWIINNYSSSDRLVVLANTRFAGDGRRLLADLTVAWRDGRAPLEMLVPGIEAAVFEIFPGGDKAVFRISDGADPGLWVRDLPGP